MQPAKPQTSALFDPYGLLVLREKRFRFAVAYAVDQVFAICQQLKTPGLQLEVRDRLFLSAICALNRVRNIPMSDIQQSQVNYALALLYALDGDCTEALERLTRVFEVSQHDRLAKSEVLRFMGEQHHRGGKLRRAYDAYLHSFYALQHLDDALRRATRQANAYADARHELDVLIRLCNIELELAEYSRLDDHLKLSHRLLDVVCDDVKSFKARLAWVEAQRLRSLGKIDAAYESAFRAIAAQNAAPTAASGRTYVIVIDIILDRITNQTQSISRKYELLHETDELASRARIFFEDHSDAIGHNLLEQAVCRADRIERLMAGQPANLKIIQRVLRSAEKLDDAALIGRAYTVFGAELEMAGDREHAVRSYQLADDRLQSNDFQSLSAWPRDALSRMAKSNTILG